MKKHLRPARKLAGRILPSGAVEIEEAGFVEGPFTREDTLEKWLVDHFDQLGLDAALIASQVQFQKGKKADLLAVRRGGQLCIVENKRDCAPREALAQLLDYSMELHELLPAELDAFCKSKDQPERTFQLLYAGHFKRLLPDHPPSVPLLVLVADTFEEDEENLALFLNRKHGFQIRLIRYEARLHGDEKIVRFSTVVGEQDQVRPLGALQPNTFVFRLEERDGLTWEKLRAGRSLRLASKFAKPLLAPPVREAGWAVLLVYLRWAGYVGIGTLKIPREDSELEMEKGPTDFDVEWIETVPAELAYFRSQSTQPLKTVQEFKDPVLWRVIVGRLRFRKKKFESGADEISNAVNDDGPKPQVLILPGFKMRSKH